MNSPQLSNFRSHGSWLGLVVGSLLDLKADPLGSK